MFLRALPFLLAIAFFTACESRLSQFKTSVEDLTPEWDTATATLNAYAQFLKIEQDACVDLQGQLNLSSVNQKRLSPSQKIELDTLQKIMALQKDNYRELELSMQVFMRHWEESNQELVLLKKAMNKSEIPEDVESRFSSLVEMIQQGYARIEYWTQTFEPAKAQRELVKKRLEQLLAVCCES